MIKYLKNQYQNGPSPCTFTFIYSSEFSFYYAEYTFYIVFFEYISFLNIFWLNLRYHPCLKFAFNGIWSKALISSLMQFFMGSVSYALSLLCIGYCIFLGFLLLLLRILCCVWGLLRPVSIRSFLIQHLLQYGIWCSV